VLLELPVIIALAFELVNPSEWKSYELSRDRVDLIKEEVVCACLVVIPQIDAIIFIGDIINMDLVTFL
jgi:hypothetical protein